MRAGLQIDVDGLKALLDDLFSGLNVSVEETLDTDRPRTSTDDLIVDLDRVTWIMSELNNELCR